MDGQDACEQLQEGYMAALGNRLSAASSVGARRNELLMAAASQMASLSKLAADAGFGDIFESFLGAGDVWADEAAELEALTAWVFPATGGGEPVGVTLGEVAGEG